MSLSRADFEFVRDLLCARSAIALPAEKLYLAEARLGPLAQAEGFDSLAEFLDEVRTMPGNDLPQKVVEALTTNETSFFRDVYPFESLRTDIFPALIQRRSTELRLTIWCAASSSGQEPYSIAMLLREHFPELSSWNISILATDLSSENLRKARAGCYNQAEINRGLPARLLVKYFRKQGTSWQITDEIRRMVEFRTLNLIDPWPLLRAPDIILLRNVLIYFGVEAKRTILDRVQNVLRPDGYLFLGGAETTLGLNSGFERTDHERAGCYRLRQLKSAK